VKWEAAPIPASSIFAFRGKIDGKLAGTLGVFVSMSGFAVDAPNALIWGKDLNVVLVDETDVALALQAGRSLRDMMHIKLRYAAQTGQIYFRYKTYLDERAE
jgi:hypothetical protein